MTTFNAYHIIRLNNKITKFLFISDKANGAIKCYECTVYPKQQNGTLKRLCTQFDESKHYEVECPFSTMCKKRTYRLQLLNGDIQETTERGCAMQKNDYMVGLILKSLKFLKLLFFFFFRIMCKTNG